MVLNQHLKSCLPRSPCFPLFPLDVSLSPLQSDVFHISPGLLLLLSSQQHAQDFQKPHPKTFCYPEETNWALPIQGDPAASEKKNDNFLNKIALNKYNRSFCWFPSPYRSIGGFTNSHQH